jgi:hypothetical protein
VRLEQAVPGFFVSWSRVAVACAGATLLAGCPLDERRLGGVSGGGGTAGTGGGAGGDGPVEVGKTLGRWSFDDGTDGWQAELGVIQRFSEDDAGKASNSGSLEVVNTLAGEGSEVATAGTSHCFPVREGLTYHVSLDVYLPADASIAGAGFALEFFNAHYCHGLLRGSASAIVPSNGSWQRIERSAPAPTEAESVLFRLIVNKVYKNPSLLARFDNVRFAETEGGEGGGGD